MVHANTIFENTAVLVAVGRRCFSLNLLCKVQTAQSKAALPTAAAEPWIHPNYLDKRSSSDMISV